jgi:putative tricarboxylic transport membrane protein
MEERMDEEPTERAWRARADLLVAAALVLLGVLVTYGSWIMPRLENRRIHPATVPGLVPGMLGAALTVCTLLLLLKAIRTPATGGWRAVWALVPTLAGARVAAVLVLTLGFTLLLVGWLPFWLATMAFVFTFIVTFELWLTDEPSPWRKTLLWAVVISVSSGVAIYLVFERVFLVRLP